MVEGYAPEVGVHPMSSHLCVTAVRLTFVWCSHRLRIAVMLHDIGSKAAQGTEEMRHMRGDGEKQAVRGFKELEYALEQIREMRNVRNDNPSRILRMCVVAASAQREQHGRNGTCPLRHGDPRRM